MKNGHSLFKSLLYKTLLGGGILIALSSCSLISEDIPLNQLVKEEQGKFNSSYNRLNSEIESIIPGIVCWGDSLTAGAGGDGTTYPNVLKAQIEDEVLSLYDLSEFVDEDLIGFVDVDYPLSVDVVNMGVGGENVSTIVARNGAIPFALAEDIVIPASTRESVEISFANAEGEMCSPLRQGSSDMINPVVIDGIEGTVEIEQDSYTSSDYHYYFRRSERGDERSVNNGSVIKTSHNDQHLDNYIVIFMGQNNGINYDPNELLRNQQAMINHQDEVNRDKFIIVGLHSGTEAQRRNLEEVMQNAWGDKYINLREYLATDGLNDAGLSPTEEDLAAIAEGSTPPSLLSDTVHFNSTGYELVGRKIFERMNELGYFDEVKVAIENELESFR